MLSESMLRPLVLTHLNDVSQRRAVRSARTRQVPVRYRLGTFDDTLRRSVRANSRDRLSPSVAEKLEGAWRLVCHDAGEHVYLPFDIAKEANVSVATVRRMTDTLKKDASRRELTWAQVLRQLDRQPEQVDAQQLEDEL